MPGDNDGKLKFGIFYDFRNPPQWRRPYEKIYADILDQIAWAENLGFEYVWTFDSHLLWEEPYVIYSKILDETRPGTVKAAICRNGDEPAVEGALFARPSRKHELLVNLRARAAPEQLSLVIERAAGRLPGKVSVAVCECFSPAPPKPEHRMADR